MDRRGWLSREEFLDTLALSQAMPGVFAVNMATAIGMRLRGFRGAATAIAGNIMAPVLMILLLAVFFRHFSDNHWVESIFKGVRPAVVALIAAPVFKMAKTAGISWRNAWIPVLSALLIACLGVSPVLVVLAAAAGGFLYGTIVRRKEGKS